MALNISVIKNPLPHCLKPFCVRSETTDIVEFDRFVDIMSKGRTTLSRTDILAAMQLFKEELLKQLAEGKTVKTPTGSFYVGASGSMDAPDEAFLPKSDENNHELRLHHRPDKDFERTLLAELEIEREERPARSAPSVQSVHAAEEGDEGAIRPGSVILIKGKRLRFDSKDQGLGVFFSLPAPSSGAPRGSEWRSSRYSQILPSSVMAFVPENLKPGTYTIVFRTLSRGRDLLEYSFEGVDIVD
jgi:hypothetical protein